MYHITVIKISTQTTFYQNIQCYIFPCIIILATLNFVKKTEVYLYMVYKLQTWHKCLHLESNKEYDSFVMGVWNDPLKTYFILPLLLGMYFSGRLHHVIRTRYKDFLRTCRYYMENEGRGAIVRRYHAYIWIKVVCLTNEVICEYMIVNLYNLNVRPTLLSIFCSGNVNYLSVIAR